MLPGDSWAELMINSLSLQQSPREDAAGTDAAPRRPHLLPHLPHIFSLKNQERFHPSMFSVSAAELGTVTSQTTPPLNIHIWGWQLDELHKSYDHHSLQD